MQDAADLWEGSSPAEWRVRWDVPQLQILSSTTSTNDVLRGLAARDAPAGTLVVTDHQTAGRGRSGRAWHDAPGMSLLFSLLLRPAPTAESLPGTAPLRIGLAVARALRRATRVEVRLKWPNDLLCGARKLGGILCEAATSGGDMSLVAGVGINLRQRPDDLPADLRALAISLEAAAGAPCPRGDIMSAIISELRPLFRQPLTALTPHELSEYRRLDDLAGRAVILGDGPDRSGIARGVAPDGALLLDVDGRIERITSATVRLHPPEPASAQRS